MIPDDTVTLNETKRCRRCNYRTHLVITQQERDYCNIIDTL